MEYPLARTYRLKPDTIDRINLLSALLRVHQSEVVDALLRAALDDIDSGRLVITTRPATWALDSIERRR